MSAEDMADFYVHTASVETYLGTNGYGADTYAPAVDVDCLADETRKLVRDKNGAQVVSDSTLATYPTNAALFAPGSKVTVGGNVSKVIRVSTANSGDLDLPDHIEVSLT